MSNLQIFQQQDFSGGLNLRSDQFQLADNESPQLLNVEIDPRGGIFSRGGMERINSTAIDASNPSWSPQKLWSFYGHTPRIMLTTATNVFHSTGANFTKLEYSAGNAVTANSGHGPCLAFWGKTAYIATGTTSTSGGYSWQTTSTYATAITASGSSPHPWQTSPTDAEIKIPQCEHLVVHANKMFAANVSEPPASNVTTPIVAYPNRIRWSLEGRPTNWAYDDYIDINGGGDGITAMVVVQGQLVVFKPRGTYIVTGYDSNTFAVTELSNTLGVQDHHMVAASDIGCYFYSNGRGLFYYNGSTIMDIFQPLKPMLDLGYVNLNASGNVTVSWVGQRVWLSLPYSKTYSPSNITTNFVYDPSLNSYMQFQTADGYGVMGGTNFLDSTNTEYRLFAHPVQRVVLNVDKYGVSTDNITGTPQGFESYYRTKWFDAGTYMQRKMFRRPEIVIKESNNAQTITVSVFHDYDEQSIERSFQLTQPQTGGLVWGAGLWGENWAAGAESSSIAKGRNLGLAKTVQMQFNGPVGQEWGINSVGFKYQPRRVMG